MSIEEIKNLIGEITENTFKVIKNVYEFQKETKPEERKSLKDVGSRIIFPRYYSHNNTSSKEEDRISEQELRFIFVEQLNKYASEKEIDNLYYSVETPTENMYNFQGEDPKVIERNDENSHGVSARTDLAIYTYEEQKFNRRCLIEFKALNPGKKNYEKDFFKLNTESAGLKYFIQIIKNSDNGTIKSLTDKTKSARNTQYKCYCLEDGTLIPIDTDTD